MPKSYWLNLFSFKTWTEFREAGSRVTGFRESRWNTVQRIKPGDLMLCYLTGVSRWIGLLEVTGPAFEDREPIWEDDPFPVRLPVRPLVELVPETAVPILEMKEELSIFQNLTNPHAWTGHLRGSPTKWKTSDGEAVEAVLANAVRNPVERAFDSSKLSRRPPVLRGRDDDALTVPEEDEVDSVARANGLEPSARPEATTHTEIQWLLVKLGHDMGLNVWVARNDRNRDYNGRRFTELSRLLDSLPVQFDPATTRTIELIDVLWLEGNSIRAAFEIESTTSIYSGLLRMADLISMQPNLAIPLFIVAPDERRNKVKLEINRPTFSKLKPPLIDVCRYISFDQLRQNVDKAGSLTKHLKAEFLDDFAEVCTMDDA